VPIEAIAVCNDENKLLKLLSAVCSPVNAVLLVFNWSMGSDAIDTARVTTCERSAEKVLVPLNIGLVAVLMVNSS
jgi:hypothetical protein